MSGRFADGVLMLDIYADGGSLIYGGDEEVYKSKGISRDALGVWDSVQ